MQSRGFSYTQSGHFPGLHPAADRWTDSTDDGARRRAADPRGAIRRAMVFVAAGSARCRPCSSSIPLAASAAIGGTGTGRRSFHIASPTGAWQRAGTAESMRLLLNDMAHAPGCQCHGCGIGSAQTIGARTYGVAAEGQPDYAFEMAASSIRYGRGVTAEVGMDMQNLGCSNVMLITDKNMAKLPVVQIVRESLDRAGRNVSYFDDVSVEPTGTSFQAAIDFAREKGCDAFVSVGGGSVMDTAKAANLFATFPDHELLDFVNAPVGKGLPVPGALQPHIAIPTTAGTGSETTGQAIFDYEPLKQVLYCKHAARYPFCAWVASII
jgi:hypothetical protein